MNAVNPFATRFTRPGRIPPIDHAARPIDIERIHRQLVARGHAAIVGPHGSGKSTLLAHVFESLRCRGENPRWLRLRSWGDAPRLLWAVARARPGATVCVDSWECVVGLPGWIARAWACARGCRLLVTSHRPAGFPVLVECRPTPVVLASLLRHLPGYDEWYGRTIRADDVEDAFTRHHGDIREALFDLYDRFESRTRSRIGPDMPVVPGVSAVPRGEWEFMKPRAIFLPRARRSAT